MVFLIYILFNIIYIMRTIIYYNVKYMMYYNIEIAYKPPIIHQEDTCFNSPIKIF